MNFIQKLFPQVQKPTPEETQQRLMEILRFSKRDLKANQNGHMSREQHYWFIDRFLRRSLSFIGITVVGGWIFFRTTNPTLVVICVTVAIVFGLVEGWKMLVDLIKKEVTIVTGPGYIHWSSFSKAYFFEVKESRFQISRKLSQALVSDMNYTVYFARRSRIILAIEVE